MEKPTSTRPKKGGSYPPEFRIEAVRYWLSSGKKSKAVAAELGMSDWSLNHWRQEQEKGVVMVTPVLDDASSVVQVYEPFEVQALIAHLAVKVFDDAVLSRLTRLDEVQLDLILVGPLI